MHSAHAQVQKPRKPTFQYTFICSACCCCTVSTVGCSSATATREPAVAIPTGKAPASACALSSNRKRCTSAPSFSSRRTPRSTHANNALSAAGRSIGPTRSIRSFTVQTSDEMRVRKDRFTITGHKTHTLLRKKLDKCCFKRWNIRADGAVL